MKSFLWVYSDKKCSVFHKHNYCPQLMSSQLIQSNEMYQNVRHAKIVSTYLVPQEASELTNPISITTGVTFRFVFCFTTQSFPTCAASLNQKPPPQSSAPSPVASAGLTWGHSSRAVSWPSALSSRVKAEWAQRPPLHLLSHPHHLWTQMKKLPASPPPPGLGAGTQSMTLNFCHNPEGEELSCQLVSLR